LIVKLVMERYILSFDDSGTTDDVESRTYSSEEESIQPSGMRLLYVIAIGLGFFTTGVSWSVYNSYLPADFIPFFIPQTNPLQNTIIGAIMVLDNVFALFLQPWIGAKSDSTRTKWGRRMPYIMIGTPIAAAFFTLIAYGWAVFGFWLMLAIITIFNVSMAFYRAPVVALMPDLVSDEHRTKANGVINLMGGIGAIYAFAIASQIYKIEDPAIGAILGVTAEQSGPVLAFLTTSIIMVVAVIILFIAIKEPKVPPEDLEKAIGIREALSQVSFSEDKSAIAVLGAILFWFLGYNALETWWTKYGGDILSFETADASFQLTGFALSFVIFAVPAGLIAIKLGRRNTILLGLIIMIGTLCVTWFMTDYYVILALLAIAGLGWAFVNVNSIVMVWQQLGQEKVGAGTGLYYCFSMTAAIVGPFITGVIFDITAPFGGGIGLLFPVSIIFLIIAFILTIMVRTGEVGDQAISNE
jgi:Na+/melibiose symporter-like transporter